MRLQKYLAHSGVASRRRAEELIREGRVTVNGETVTEMGIQIDPDVDTVRFNGRLVEIKKKYHYVVLNKPKGYVTSCNHHGEKIVLDLIDIPERIYPVGRLDKDSTGLLLLTNDGRIHHRLSHPSFDHEKEYTVTLAKPISDDALEKMSAGIYLGNTKTRPAKVDRISGKKFKIVLQEGKNRQIRRMVEKVANRVVSLKRIRVANITLGPIKPGAWRLLKGKEKKELFKALGISS